jgi:hypothetical protein
MIKKTPILQVALQCARQSEDSDICRLGLYALFLSLTDGDRVVLRLLERRNTLGALVSEDSSKVTARLISIGAIKDITEATDKKPKYRLTDFGVQLNRFQLLDRDLQFKRLQEAITNGANVQND